MWRLLDFAISKTIPGDVRNNLPGTGPRVCHIELTTDDVSKLEANGQQVRAEIAASLGQVRQSWEQSETATKHKRLVADLQASEGELAKVSGEISDTERRLLDGLDAGVDTAALEAAYTNLGVRKTMLGKKAAHLRQLSSEAYDAAIRELRQTLGTKLIQLVKDAEADRTAEYASLADSLNEVLSHVHRAQARVDLLTPVARDELLTSILNQVEGKPTPSPSPKPARSEAIMVETELSPVDGSMIDDGSVTWQPL